jgi:hypothetical protein
MDTSKVSRLEMINDLESHVHLMASHGGNSTNTQIHLNFGEQPPFYQNLAG